jgi:hypothetical protein
MIGAIGFMVRALDNVTNAVSICVLNASKYFIQLEKLKN